MKECVAAVKALRSKAATYVKLAQVMERLDKFAEGYRPKRKRTPTRPARRLSKAGRARIRAAQKARWDRYRNAHKGK